MSQTNVREGYRIMTLEVVELVEDLISYMMMLAKVRQYSAKVKTEDLSNTPTLILSETAQRRSSSVVSNRSTVLITDKFGVASLTEPAILNDANVALVDAVHHSVESQQKLEENYFEVRAQHLKYNVIDALTMTLIEDDDDLLGTVNSHIKLRRLGALSPPEQPLLPKKRGRHSKLILDGPPLKRRKTEAADSRYAKASRGRTKKDKDLEDSDTSSDVPRLRRRDRAAARARLAKRKQLGKEAQLKKTRDEEKLAKAKKEKEEKEARDDDYRLDSSSDIDPKDNSEDEEATTAKDLNEGQSLCKSGDGNRTLHSRRGVSCDFTLYQLTDAYILYFKELSSDNSGIFANAIGIGKTRAIVLAVLMGHCDSSDLLALRFCFFSNSPPENMGRLTKEEAIEMRIDTTDAISKALAAANKLVASQSYIIPEANTPAVHSEATKHCLAPSAAQFIIVCGFGKVDKHVFRAYNTISVTAQRTIIRKGGPYIEKRAILLPTLNGLAMAKQWRNIIANVKHDASEHKSSHEYKELISQGAAAIASYSALATLKAAQFKTYGSRKVKRFTLNSVKDLFTNSSKDYFLVREARAITKSSPKFQNLSNLCSKVEILGTLSRTWSIAAEDAAKAANTLLPPKEVRAKILIELYKPIVQAVT
ncbi:hypothetical protein HBI88_096280 [Parastagonospora nodorum]|nr:hypothetical protein HBI97_203870 [Parastagonospora nodorum]KAH5794576.1 hypothetical protein HBI94_253090 [Parastagonospora nodorum]KAH5807413.1 hypothetical protein HBI96_108010 [Parastagonospora nodorum]KAH5809145.1 hypothetical protein HBI93_234690 [Parastagonospora nodorum]KAH5844592.1 hypothetical protein HBI91_240490 [Parastagonospora nodorum]